MLNLTFASAIPGTFPDKDGQGTGFTYVQSNINADQYDPSRINLVPEAGTLVLTATQGSNTSANTLKNALQVGLDTTQTFTVSTRLQGPLTNLRTAVQQGGLVIGPSQDNYAKLVAINTGKDLRIQFFKEENGLGSTVDQITGLNWGEIKTLDLYLTGDPVTNTITAAYRVNSNTAAPIPLTQNFQPDQTASFFADEANARAGILAFSKDAMDVPVTFNYFGIAQDLKINFQPSTAAVPAEYIADSGEAYDPTLGFGWVTQDSLSSQQHIPLSIASYGRQRNRSGVDARLDTVLQMQYPNTPTAAWEYAVPNGTYTVTVSVGDQPRQADGVYDSINTINVEGVNAIQSFQSTPNQEYQLATVTTNVSDGRLTVDAIGGTNTKINYLEIENITPGNHPSVTGSSIASDATGVYLDAAVDVDVSLPTVGVGVDEETLNTTNVQLYRTKDNAVVPGVVSTSGNGDAIVYQPSVLLEPNTNYTFRIANDVRDESGATFIPYSTAFNTGTNAIVDNLKINFQPSTAAVPAGYIADSGEAYDPTRGFGWVTQDSLSSGSHTPLSIAYYGRQRNRSGVDPRLDTVLQMQYSATPPAAWEYAVPNGTYSVTVSVGDQPRQADGVYDSINTINVEGVNAINGFQSTLNQEYQLATVTTNVSDGRLTVDAIGGTNTKINYLEIENITPGNHPSVTGSSIASDATGVYIDAAVDVDVSLPTVGAGVNEETLNTTNVQLYRTKDNFLVPGIVGTTGGGDAIIYQPTMRLEPNTNYTFKVTSGVTDEADATFIPYSTTFNTGTNAIVGIDPQVNFTKSTVYAGAPISSLVISPDGNQVYAAGLDGQLRRWTIDSLGNLTNLQTFSPSQLAGRGIIGLAFDPNNANNLWLTHNDPLFPTPANDFSGKISKLTLNGTDFAATTVEDYAFGLPRSSKDHFTNSLVFGSDGKLYVSQGSNSAMGAADPGWYNRPERLLSGTVLQIDPMLTPPPGGFNLQTENYQNTTGSYNPYDTDAPVKIYATGIRNAYDLVWHSNGNLYAPTNGSAAGGNTPDDPATPVNESLIDVGTQNDYLFKILQGGYYGHPNPKRQEYIMNGGNPTSGVDLAEVVQEVTSTGTVYAGYPVGIQPDPDYQGFAYDFGRNRSPNGAIEYQSDSFGGVLKNKLLVVEYSGGDDILALPPDANGNIPSGNVTQVISGLTNPLDLIEDTKKNVGNLYVAELIDEGASGQISLLKVT